MERSLNVKLLYKGNSNPSNLEWIVSVLTLTIAMLDIHLNSCIPGTGHCQEPTFSSKWRGRHLKLEFTTAAVNYGLAASRNYLRKL